ncbi:hypothetical protein MHZ93_19885 [Roseomonas sp. ACRSG]|nr:hypothetical protein [Roseomonas sp. ACRSG]
MTDVNATAYRPAFRAVPVVTNDVEHDALLAEIDTLMDLEPSRDSPDGVRLRLLARISAEYEEEHYPIEPLTPPETIAFAMERHGINRAQIAKVVGGASRASDLLNARRRLTDVDRLKALASLLHVPLDLLAIPYKTVDPAPRTQTETYVIGRETTRGHFSVKNLGPKSGASRTTVRGSSPSSGSEASGMRIAASKRGKKTTG